MAGFKTKYTLKSVSKNMATITVEGEIEMNPGEGMEGKISGTQTGTMIVDTKTGLPVINNVFQNMKGAYKMQGMEMQQEIRANTKTSIKEK